MNPPNDDGGVDDAASRPAAPASPSVAGGASLRVLHADDHPTVRESVKLRLERLGHQVLSVVDGDAALASAAAERFDVVITDHQMPGKNGLAVVQSLRAHRFPGRIYVFCADLSDAHRAAYRRHKVDGIAEKPFGVAELEAWIG